MRLIFVHGWSVTDTSTYGDLPASLVAGAATRGIQLDIQHIHLGKYVSFHDEVTIDDIARALNFALNELPGNSNRIAPFSCITHSTGGPVVRHWVEKYYGAKKLDKLPLKHLVMLAPANHGSSLAALGKKRVGRIKSWFAGVEPGQGVLDWLSLGSAGQWQLNEAALKYKATASKFFQFVLTGQGIDTQFYDFLNGYLVESGSDGVVRVAGANMNYRFLSLRQTDEPIKKGSKVRSLVAHPNKPVRTSPKIALGVFHNFSHSGRKMGIMTVAATRPAHSQIVTEILGCLAVNTARQYETRAAELNELTTAEQLRAPNGKDDLIGRNSMLVFRVHDELGNIIQDEDFDVLLLGGPRYREDKLPKGFFLDRQFNRQSESLVYYLNADKMQELEKGLYGFRVVARPEKGFSYFFNAEFRSDGMAIDKVFSPNQTTYIDVTLNRQVDKNVFRFTGGRKNKESFKDVSPSGKTVP
jgi:hypothetical protein